MSELLLVNPKRRKRSKRRRPMTAKQLMYFGKGRRKSRKRRTASAARPVRRHRRRSRVVAATRPVHRRRSHSRRRRHVTRLRRNPLRLGSFSIKRFLNDTLIPAGVGATGALGVDLALGYAAPYIPVSLQSGPLHTVVKIAGAVGVGMVAGMAMGKKFGEEAMAGAITVTLYDLIKGYAKAAMPTLPLSGVGWVSPGMQIGGYLHGVGAYVGSDGAYSGRMGTGMGYYVGETDADYYRTYAGQ